jgi:hypothetical protein
MNFGKEGPANPKMSRLPVVSYVRIAVLAVALLGCAPRFDHFHSDGNQKLANDAVSSFDSFTGSREGLLAVFLRNLEAQAVVERAVSQKQIRLKEGELLSHVFRMTWDEVWDDLFASLGLIDDLEPAWLGSKVGEPSDMLLRILRVLPNDTEEEVEHAGLYLFAVREELVRLLIEQRILGTPQPNSHESLTNFVSDLKALSWWFRDRVSEQTTSQAYRISADLGDPRLVEMAEKYNVWVNTADTPALIKTAKESLKLRLHQANLIAQKDSDVPNEASIKANVDGLKTTFQPVLSMAPNARRFGHSWTLDAVPPKETLVDKRALEILNTSLLKPRIKVDAGRIADRLKSERPVASMQARIRTASAVPKDDPKKGAADTEIIQLKNTIRRKSELTGALLQERMRTRLEKILAIVQVMEALAKGHKLLLEKGKAKADRSQKAINGRIKDLEKNKGAASSQSAGPEKAKEAAKNEKDPVLELLDQFIDLVTRVGKEESKNNQARKQAEELQQALLERANESRDPSSIYALVAIVGTGLDSDSLTKLESFHSKLAERLAGLTVTIAKEDTDSKKQQKGKQQDPTNEEDDPTVLAASRDFVESVLKAQFLLAATHAKDSKYDLAVIPAENIKTSYHNTLREVDFARAVSQAQGTQVFRKRPRSSLVGIKEDKASLVQGAKLLGVQLPPAAVEVLKELDVDPDGKGDVPSTDAVNKAIKGILDADLGSLLNDGGYVDKALSAIESVGIDLGIGIEQLREKTATLPDSLKKLMELSPNDVLDPKVAIPKVIEAALEADPSIKNKAQKILGTPILGESAPKDEKGEPYTYGKYLQKLFADVAKAEADGKALIADFVGSLQQIQLDLHSEQVRHYGILLTILKDEIKRWKLIKEQSEKFIPMFERDAPPANKLLFVADGNDGKDKLGGSSWNGGLPAANAQSEHSHHPLIQTDDKVLSSLRRLSATANYWQRELPNKGTLDHHSVRSNDRLKRAVAIISHYVLLSSVNRRYGDWAVIRLRTEIAEHDLYIDAIISRVHEAGLRSSLRELAVYHASGITDQDILCFLSVIQTTFLGTLNFRVHE